MNGFTTKFLIAALIETCFLSCVCIAMSARGWFPWLFTVVPILMFVGIVYVWFSRKREYEILRKLGYVK